MLLKFLINMVYLEEIFLDGKKMAAKENKEEEGQLMDNCRVFYIKKFLIMTFVMKSKFDNKLKN
jgi:hypothetical protein